MGAAPGNPESVFAVLDAAARKRSTRTLALQLVFSAGLATAIVAATPHWWYIAALLGAPACYAFWGLLTVSADRRTGGPAVPRILAFGTAAAGTLLALAGASGLALALFTGHGRSPYNACGPSSTTAQCQAWAHPPPARFPLP